MRMMTANNKEDACKRERLPSKIVTPYLHDKINGEIVICIIYN